MTNLDSMLKSKDITLLINVYIVKAMVFPVVMHGCVSWTVKKAECQIIDAFELWCWRSPLDSKEIKLVNFKGDQPWIFTGRTDAEAEAPVFWSCDANWQLIGKDPDAWKDWGQKGRRGHQRMRWLNSITNEHELGQTGRWWGTGTPGVLQSMGSQGVRYDWATE